MKSQSYKTILNPHRGHFKLIGINKAGPYVCTGQPKELFSLWNCGWTLFFRYKVQGRPVYAMSLASSFFRSIVKNMT